MASIEKIAQLSREQQLPAALVDLDRFDANIKHAADIVKEINPRIKIRVATKSIRVPELIKRVMDADPIFQGLMCYSAQEARFLADQGFDDLLIAYPTLQTQDLTAFRQVHEWGKKVTLMVDSLEAIKTISEFAGDKITLKLILDVDMSLRLFGGAAHLGVRRSGVRTVEQVLDIFEQAKQYKNIHLCGLMGYEAQVAGLGDRNPFKRLMSIAYGWVRKVSIKRVAQLRLEIVNALAAQGVAIEIFNGGGTGSLNTTSKEQAVTEVTVGSGFLSSHLFDYYSNIRFKPAAFFACHVCRKSDPSIATCQGGGYIASGVVGWDKSPVAVYPPEVSVTELEGSGEVQTPVAWSHGKGVEPGDVVLFRHAKAGELAERFNEYLLINSDGDIHPTKTYRGYGECYF